MEGIINDMTEFMLKYFKHLFIAAQKVIYALKHKGKKAIPCNRLRRPIGL
jgi:hypothetical protein